MICLGGVDDNVFGDLEIFFFIMLDFGLVFIVGVRGGIVFVVHVDLIEVAGLFWGTWSAHSITVVLIIFCVVLGSAVVGAEVGAVKFAVLFRCAGVAVAVAVIAFIVLFGTVRCTFILFYALVVEVVRFVRGAEFAVGSAVIVIIRFFGILDLAVVLFDALVVVVVVFIILAEVIVFVIVIGLALSVIVRFLADRIFDAHKVEGAVGAGGILVVAVVSVVIRIVFFGRVVWYTVLGSDALICCIVGLIRWIGSVVGAVVFVIVNVVLIHVGVDGKEVE